MSRRTSPKNWCAAGLGLLRDEGLEAITVERLSRIVGRTKGSFYHHFRDFDGYLQALLLLWEKELTENLILATTPESDPARRSARIEGLARALDHDLDRAVRAWALRDRLARAAMRRVDRRRIDYLAGLFRENGYRKPRVLAELRYLAFVGAQQTGVFDAPDRADRLAKELGKAIAWLGGRDE